MHRLITLDNIHEASLISLIFIKGEDNSISICGVEINDSLKIHISDVTLEIQKEDIYKIKLYSVSLISNY